LQKAGNAIGVSGLFAFAAGEGDTTDQISSYPDLIRVPPGDDEREDFNLKS
jgi:hypothetical protein